MKKTILLLIVCAVLFMLLSDTQTVKNKSCSIRVYSNTNAAENALWLTKKAAEAGFFVHMDDRTVLSGDAAVVQAANENKDGDLIFGLNETRWAQIVNGSYENLKLVDWKPSWAEFVGSYAYPGKAYGLVIQNILMLYRTDELGTNGKKLVFEHWADVVNSGCAWFRQGKVGGTTNSNINNALLFPFADPDSPAGGISVDGWKTLWQYCSCGHYTGDSYGFDPLNRGEVQVSTYYSSSLYGKIDSAGHTSEKPLLGTLKPQNWALVDIKDGSYYVAEYIGILDRPGRTAEETQRVKDFAEWLGSADVQAAWAEEFDTYPCNVEAVKKIYPEPPAIYSLENCAFKQVKGTGMNYAAYVSAHSKEWTNIMTNLGFYWADTKSAPEEPDWKNLDWTLLSQSSN